MVVGDVGNTFKNETNSKEGTEKNVFQIETNLCVRTDAKLAKKLSESCG